MDIKAPQVALSTVIGELTLKNEQDFGVDYFAQIEPSCWHDQYQLESLPDPRDSAATVSRAFSTRAISSTLYAAWPPAAAARARMSISVAAGPAWPQSSTCSIRQVALKCLTAQSFSRPTTRKPSSPPDRKSPFRSAPFRPSFRPDCGFHASQQFRNPISIQYKKVALQLEVVPLINSEKEVIARYPPKARQRRGFDN